MKRILRDRIPILLSAFALIFSGCNRNNKGKHEAMSHDVVHDSISHLVEPTDEVVVANIETIRPQTGSRFESVTAQGVINYNEDNLSSLSSRVSGRIERLYVRFNYQKVSKGQKIMEIYSPDLVNAQQELLFLHRNNEPELAALARKKLLLLGVSEQQINALLKTGKVDYAIAVYSTSSGYITENTAQAGNSAMPAGGTVLSSSSTTGSSGGMAGMADAGLSEPASQDVPVVPGTTPLGLREGEYVSKGQTLFKVINADKVRAEFYIKPDQIQSFKRGGSVSVISADSKDKHAEVAVNMIQPYYSNTASYPLVRVVLPNSDKRWRVGELVQLNLKEVRKDGTWLPRSAVQQLGASSVLFVKKNGVFKSVKVNVLSSAGNWINVGSAVTDEEVALHAGFLMDGESFIQVDNQ